MLDKRVRKFWDGLEISVKNTDKKAYFHLPGLFEFYELYSVFLELYKSHREYFYDWCQIGSIYGSPTDCLWGGGRVEISTAWPEDVIKLMAKHGISARLTFSNSLLTKEHLIDKKCNDLCRLFEKSGNNGVILHSDLLLEYIKDNYPALYRVSSTTKVITDFAEFKRELDRDEFSYVVADFRLNNQLSLLSTLSDRQKDKVEFLCNECCSFDCISRKDCYEDVSRKNLGIKGEDHVCPNLDSNSGYMFSKAMENPGFISREAIENIFLPMGFSHYKIEGRGLGSALILEFLLYYMVKERYQIHVREAIYLDNMLDIF